MSIPPTQLTLAEWQQVPARVQALLPTACALQLMHNKVASETGILAIATISWQPEKNEIFVHTPNRLSNRVKEAYANTLHAGVPILFTQTTPDSTHSVLIKQASMTKTIGAGWNTANTALGGPTPLSNAIVSSLLLGGIGYGAGTLAEQLFPERFLEPGQLRKPLGIAGGLIGLGYGALNAGEIRRQLPGTGYLNSWVTSNNAKLPNEQPPVPGKKANFFGADKTQGNTGLYAPTIPVDAFNRAVWSDASKGYSQAGIVPHTSPAVAAATTGLMTGLSTQARSSIISPATVITGLVSAGVGLATANIAGRTLGALAGLTPMAQEKIQDAGLWAGMLHAVVPPLFGMR